MTDGLMNKLLDVIEATDFTQADDEFVAAALRAAPLF
jgi:hypothetical protein